MIYKRLGILGAISVAAVVSGVLVGCSSSSSVTPSSPTVDTTGGLTSNPGTGAPTGSSGKPQQVQVTVNGQTEQATLPPYETITSGENIAVLPSTPGTPILAGLGYGTTAAVKKVKPDAPGIQGEVFVDGHDTGITVTSGGYLSGPLILVPGYHVIIAYGPWVIVSGNVFNPQQLNVNNYMEFGVWVNTDGQASVPSTIGGALPANGGGVRNGHEVTVTYTQTDFLTGSGSLQLDGMVSPSTLFQQKPVVNGSVIFRGFSSNDTVPTAGLNDIIFNYIQTTTP